MATTTAGGLIDLFLADPTLTGTQQLPGLVPSGAWLLEVPEELSPLPFVVVEDLGQESKWLSQTAALVRQKVRFQAFARAAATAGAENPAEGIAKAIRAALNQSSPNAGSKIRMLWVLELSYALKLAPKRSPDGERVYQADLVLNLGFERTT